MKFARYLVALAAVTLVGCESTPTAPPPAPTIAVSHGAVSLERTATTQVTATSTLANMTTDITAGATWRSSNEQVARVAAGLITAVGPGTASVTVESAGASQTVTVTVRRRVYLEGEVKVVDERGIPGGIAHVDIFLDDRYYGGRNYSSPTALAIAPFGNISDANKPVAPGSHRFELRIPTRPGDAYSEYTFTITFQQAPRVIDVDTREQVGTVPLENRSAIFPDNPTITWTFTLQSFTS